MNRMEEMEALTLNRTFDEIYNYYTEEYWPKEFMLRQMIRNYFSRYLMDNDEDNPKEVDIIVELDNACGMSSLEMPRIKKMWQENGIIWCQEDWQDNPIDFDDYSIYEQMSILGDFKDYINN